MGVLTFDWGQITYIGSPLSVPWWAAVNIGITIVFFYWFLTPILYVSLPNLTTFLYSYYLAVLQCLVQRLPSFGVLTRLR
jgi:hypothetical protein